MAIPISPPTRGIYEKVPGSKVWWIRWTDTSGTKRREKAGARAAAIHLLAKRKTEKLQRLKLPETIRAKVLTFGQITEDALAHSREANGERSSHELALKLGIIAPAFESLPAASVSKHDIQTWLMEQADKRRWSPATRNRYQAAFSLIFRVAVDNEKLTVNPASRIKRKAEHNDRIRFLSIEEEKRLVSALVSLWPHYLPAFTISTHTGMRAGEQFSLEWRDVSLENRLLTLHRTKPGKTRHIPLNSVALAAFETLRAGDAASGPVFLNTAGDPLRSARDWFEPAVKLAGLKDYTWHSNRHTFASRLVQASVDIRTVAQLLGHSTIQMTMRYAHLAPEHNQAAVDRLVMGNPSSGTRKNKGTPKRTPAKTVNHKRSGKKAVNIRK